MQAITGSQDLVGQIAGFTSLRDIDLLELSLLKSIYSIVNPIEVSLITVDRHNEIRKKVDFAAGRQGKLSDNGIESEPFNLACDQLDHTTLEYATVSYQEGSLTLFLLGQERRLTHFVSIISAQICIPKKQAQQISGMLKIYRNFKQLLKEAQTDELTGLPNRKTFEHTTKNIHDAIIEAPSFDGVEKRDYSEIVNTYWLAMVDIDYFKRVNDNHGHIMGDEVLVRIAQTLQCSIRSEDYLFRYGGEEFAAIVRARTQQECEAILERARASCEALQFSNIGTITISIGAVQMNPTMFYLTTVESADTALYYAKKNGRNQVRFFNELPEEYLSDALSNKSDNVDLF